MQESLEVRSLAAPSRGLHTVHGEKTMAGNRTDTGHQRGLNHPGFRKPADPHTPLRNEAVRGRAGTCQARVQGLWILVNN